MSDWPYGKFREENISLHLSLNLARFHPVDVPFTRRVGDTLKFYCVPRYFEWVRLLGCHNVVRGQVIFPSCHKYQLSR